MTERAGPITGCPSYLFASTVPPGATNDHFRILVTGSRDWKDEKVLRSTLWAYIDKHESVTLVHGDCPTGADAMVNWFEQFEGIEIERHPADWAQYKRAAGPRRNAEMVELGADICVAFIKNNSRGASGTVGMATRANIPTRVRRCE